MKYLSRRDFIRAGCTVVKLFRFIIPCLLVLWLAAPSEARFPRGFILSTQFSKSVLNMNFGADQFANIANGMVTTQTGNGNTLLNFNADGFPHGVLTGISSLSQTALPQNYFGHFSSVSVGNSGLNTFFVPPLIVYNGGNSVLSVSPSNTGVSASGGGGIGFLPNGNWNIEFAFGDLVTGVADNGSGFVRLTTSTTGAGATVGATITVQIHNLTGISSSSVYTATKRSNNTFDLLALPYSAGMSVIAGGPGTASEMIMQLSSVTWSWWQSTTGFSNINHTITSWIFCKTSDLAAVQAGQVISSPAISFITALKPKWLRFMDMIGVQAASGQFQYLPASTSLNYSSTHYQNNYYGGATTSVGDAFTVAPGPSSPTSGAIGDGEVIEFIADHTSGLLPSLVMSGRSTPAAPILTNDEGYLFFNTAGQPSGSAITSISGSGTTATVTATANHGFNTGQLFITNISGNTPSGFNGSNILATATGANTFTYANTTSGSTSVAGTFTPQVADGDIINMTFTASNFSGGAHTYNYYVNLASASFTATVSGTTLTVSSVGAGRITPGQRVTGTSLSNGNATILPYGSGSTTGTGGTGTYALDVTTTGTVTGTTSRTGAGCGSGVVNSINVLPADMSCAMQFDSVLGGQQFIIGNNGGTGILIYYAPAVAQVTPSVTITKAGGTAEVVTPSYGGGLTSGTTYTAQYRASAGGWITNSGGLQVGIPLNVMKEYAQRTGAGIWYNISMNWTIASASSFGTYMATNLPGIPLHIEVENELWNVGQNPNHAAQALGASLGFPGVLNGLYFQSIYATLGWSIENLSEEIVTAYLAAGGSRSNIYVGMIMSGSDGQGCAVTTGGCVGGQTGGVQTAFLGAQLTPTPASFTGTINPATNGYGATLTVTGLTGVLYPGYQINGAGVTAGTHIAGCSPSLNQCIGNGTYQIDTSYGSTVGPVTMTATNVIYSAVGGPGATSTTANFTAFPNRPIDLSDDVGYATYFTGALAGEGSGSWSGASPTPYAALLQASDDYATGLATSNSALMTSALNAWSADVNGKAAANTTGRTGNYTSQNICGFLGSTTTLGFCNNAPNAVISGTTSNSSTLTVTAVTGTITPGMQVAQAGISGTPVIFPYGTGGTSGTGNTGTYALSSVYNSGTMTNVTIGIPIGPVQGWANIVAAFNGARPSGKANLGIEQYEGSLQQAFCAGGCPVGNIVLATDSVTLASQMTSNGWNLDPTYGYPGFGSGNSQTAFNVIQLYLAYVNSPQYYNDTLFFYQSEATINAAQPFFGLAQYGIEGNVGTTATTGAPQWGLLPGDLSTPPLQNYFAQQYINTH